MLARLWVSRRAGQAEINTLIVTTNTIRRQLFFFFNQSIPLSLVCLSQYVCVNNIQTLSLLLSFPHSFSPFSRLPQTQLPPWFLIHFFWESFLLVWDPCCLILVSLISLSLSLSLLWWRPMRTGKHPSGWSLSVKVLLERSDESPSKSPLTKITIHLLTKIRLIANEGWGGWRFEGAAHLSRDAPLNTWLLI